MIKQKCLCTNTMSLLHITFAQFRNWQETGQDYCMYTLHNEMHLLTKEDVASVQDFH